MFSLHDKPIAYCDRAWTRHGSFWCRFTRARDSLFCCSLQSSDICDVTDVWRVFPYIIRFCFPIHLHLSRLGIKIDSELLKNTGAYRLDTIVPWLGYCIWRDMTHLACWTLILLLCFTSFKLYWCYSSMSLGFWLSFLRNRVVLRCRLNIFLSYSLYALVFCRCLHLESAS